ncbi:NEAT domain-containing protein [Cohnella sp. WQ 127256]|uniref:NEAT domain-containing protein n=1 Tax=Cohnella sp. WQ 127256 TaxID=2938790 RepID=UPI00211764E3|nr:NEAT domain-containing protein [Cohnella sp. WQ 127256]
MLFKASSRVNIAGTFLVMMMVILLLVPQPAHAEQVNGEYTIGFNIMHADKKNASIAEGYWNQPAKVFIKDGSIRVQTTINKHAWVTQFAISYNGSMSEVRTISIDEVANARITEFQASNFTDLIESKVSVNIEEMDYEHSYTMYFKFKPDTLTLVKADKPQVPDASQNPTPAPALEVKPADQAKKPKEIPASTPAPTESATSEPRGTEPALQVDQSDKDITASEAKEQTAESAGKAGSDEGSGNEPSDAAQQEKDASETSVMEETADASAVPTEETLEQAEGGNGSQIAIVIAIIIVLIAIIAVIVNKTRHNKKTN